jgi:hypothetical protein
MSGTVTGLPNWVFALGLAACAVGSYYYTVMKVGSTDLNAAVEKELKKSVDQQVKKQADAQGK